MTSVRLLTLLAALALCSVACTSGGAPPPAGVASTPPTAIAAPEAASTPAPTAVAMPGAPPGGPCANGIAVPEPDRNPWLVADCNTLLAVRGAFAAAGPLTPALRTWNARRPVDGWWGVGVSGSPARVQALALNPLFYCVGDNRNCDQLPRPDPVFPVTRTPHSDGSVLSGSIPREIVRLADLRDLDLGWNDLTGTIPPEIGGLVRLERLLLDGNDLSGAIPAGIGRLTRLKTLSLGGNRLTGGIPPEIGALEAIEYLDLAYNELSGRIPPDLGGLVRLRQLYLQDNRLTGDVPPEWGRLADLDDIGLIGNPLTGNLPPPDGPCANGVAVPEPEQNRAMVRECNTLLAARDVLAGGAALNWSADLFVQLWDGVGPGWASWDAILELREANRAMGYQEPVQNDPRILRLLTLDLRGKGLTGSIPPELGDLSRLERLDLGGNELTGGIPPEIGNLTKLEVLAISGNRLTGCVPQALVPAYLIDAVTAPPPHLPPCG